MEARPRPSKPQRKTDGQPLDPLRFALGALTAALAFVVPFLPDEKLTRMKLQALELGVFALLLVAGIQVILRKIKPNRLACVVAIWALATVALWAMSPEKSLATSELRRVLTAAAAFLAVSLAGLDDAWKQRILGCWVAAGSIIAVYGLLQKNGGVGVVMVPQMDRVMGTYGNPIFFAAFLVPTIFLSIQLLLSARSSVMKSALGIGIAVQLAALYLTQTRAAWLASLISALIVVTTSSRPAFGGVLSPSGAPGAADNKRGPGLKIAGVTAMVLFAGVFAFKTKDVWRRDQGHLLIWRDTLRMWKAHPVTGVGLGAFHTNFQSFAGDDLKAKWPEGKIIINEAHNEYLQTLAETGIVGFLAFIAVPVLFFLSVTPGWSMGAVLAMFMQNVFSVDMRFTVSLAACYLLMGLLSSKKWEEPAGPAAPPHPAQVALCVVWAIALIGFALPQILKPYRAQRTVAATPDFFDQRLLDPAKSISDLEELRAKYPREISVLEKLAYVYAKEIRTTDNRVNTDMAAKSIAVYQDIIRVKPGHLGAYNNLANIYYTTGRTEEALSSWRKAAEIDPSFIDAQLNLGKILYVQGKLKESAQRFEAVLRGDPNNAEAIVYLKRMVE